MNVTNGNYYRRKKDGAVVKVLYYEVYPYHCSCGIYHGSDCGGEAGIVYRLDDDEYPHRREFISTEEFLNDFEEKT